MRRPATRRPKAPTIALINIVFLMLIFFMVAGTLSAPMDRDITLVSTESLEDHEPPDALVIDKNGKLRHRGQTLPFAAAFFGGADSPPRDVVRLLPDRDLPAAKLLRISAELRAAGAGRIMITTERTIQ